MALITKTEYSKRRGWSQAHTSKLVKSGKIATHYGKVDPEEADRMLAEAADPAREPFKKNGKEKGKQSSYYDARTEREVYQAKLSKLEWEKAAGNVVDVAQVKEAAFRTYRRVRDAIMLIPTRVAPLVAAQKNPHKVRMILEAELRKALEGLANGERG